MRSQFGSGHRRSSPRLVSTDGGNRLFGKCRGSVRALTVMENIGSIAGKDYSDGEWQFRLTGRGKKVVCRVANGASWRAGGVSPLSGGRQPPERGASAP